MFDIRTKCDAFNLGGNHVRRETALGLQHGNNIQEQRLGNCVRGHGEAIHATNVCSAGQVNLEELLHHSVVACKIVAALASLAVALVHQKLVIVDGADFTYAAACSELVGVMASPSIPLLAVRPAVLPLISFAPIGLRFVT